MEHTAASTLQRLFFLYTKSTVLINVVSRGDQYFCKECRKNSCKEVTGNSLLRTTHERSVPVVLFHRVSTWRNRSDKNFKLTLFTWVSRRLSSMVLFVLYDAKFLRK